MNSTTRERRALLILFARNKSTRANIQSQILHLSQDAASSPKFSVIASTIFNTLPRSRSMKANVPCGRTAPLVSGEAINFFTPFYKEKREEGGVLRELLPKNLRKVRLVVTLLK